LKKKSDEKAELEKNKKPSLKLYKHTDNTTVDSSLFDNPTSKQETIVDFKKNLKSRLAYFQNNVPSKPNNNGNSTLGNGTVSLNGSNNLSYIKTEINMKTRNKTIAKPNYEHKLTSNVTANQTIRKNIVLNGTNNQQLYKSIANNYKKIYTNLKTGIKPKETRIDYSKSNNLSLNKSDNRIKTSKSPASRFTFMSPDKSFSIKTNTILKNNLARTIKSNIGSINNTINDREKSAPKKSDYSNYKKNINNIVMKKMNNKTVTKSINLSKNSRNMSVSIVKNYSVQKEFEIKKINKNFKGI
jgi:hypothetical protein